MKRIPFSFQRTSFKTKLNLGLSVLILCMGITIGLVSTKIASKELIRENKARGNLLASNLAYRSEEPLLARNFLRLKALVDETKTNNEEIAYAFVLDQKGRVLVHSFERGFPQDLIKEAKLGKSRRDSETILLTTGKKYILDFAKSVQVSGNSLGTIRVGLFRERLEQVITRLNLFIFGLTGIITVFALATASWFANRFTDRIKSLIQSATEMVKGNLNVQSGPTLAKNCWEITKCNATSCPAYGDTRRRCWYLTGTLCPIYHPEQGPQESHSCKDCPVYQQNSGDEIQELAEAFDFMAMTLNDRICEAQNAEKELSRQKELLRTILDVTPDMVAFQDKDLVYRAANKAFCNYFRMHESHIVEKTDFDIFSEYQADQNYHEDMQILRSGKPLSKEISVKQGETTIWFHILKVPVYTEGEISGLLLSARDITVIKQYQERLVQSQKMEDLGRLAGGVAHEINTPLGIILGYVQMLIEDVEQGTQIADDLKIIEKQTKICSNIVSDLLGFSRQTETSKSEVDVNKSIQDVISLVEHTFGLNRVEILTDLDPNIPDIEGDKDRLKQIWMNLLTNAFDAIEQDGYIRISTKLCAHRRRVAITITDTGSGIKQELLNKIFDPFFSTKPVGKGTGLGLSVTFGIIKDHGGRINVLSPAPNEYFQQIPETSKPMGPGTVFLVELPLWSMTLPEEVCEEIASGSAEN